MHLRRRVCSRIQTVFTITSINFYHSPEIRSWSVFMLYKTRGPELVVVGEGSTNVRLFVSCQLKIIRGFNKHRRPTKRVGYMAQRSRLLFPPKRKQLQSWTKLLRKLHTWGALFLNFLADRFFPNPLPLKAVLRGLQKKAGSPSIWRKQLWTGGGSFLYAKAVDLEIVLLR